MFAENLDSERPKCKLEMTGLSRLPSGSRISSLGAMDQLMQYAPVLMLAGLAVLFSFGMLVLSVLLGKVGKRTRAKDVPYECGMIPIGEGSPRMSVKFYLVAMLFILFDIEVVFLYPWAVVYKSMLRDHANLIFGSMLTFLGILFVGYLYAVKKGAFDWKQDT
jgi:NADH-quinone oxidoreductase subunit A